ASTTTTAALPASTASSSAATSANSATKNPTSTLTANKSPISPLLPRGGTTNAGSTIAVAPTAKPGIPITASPIVKLSPVSTAATSPTSGTTQQGLSFCGRSIEPLPQKDIS